MPYVIQQATSKRYLKLYPHRYSKRKRREWVELIDDASTWTKLGPAKLAANQTGDNMCLIQEVKLMCWGSPVLHKAKAPR